MKAATTKISARLAKKIISIHAAREGGDDAAGCTDDCIYISIHAAREGGDKGKQPILERTKISIHAAREGGDQDSAI